MEKWQAHSGEQGIFRVTGNFQWLWLKKSPANLVYYTEVEKVQKHRLVKFSNKAARDKGTQTSESQLQLLTELNDKKVLNEDVTDLKKSAQSETGLHTTNRMEMT